METLTRAGVLEPSAAHNFRIARYHIGVPDDWMAKHGRC